MSRLILVALIAACVAASPTLARGEMTDPYEILAKHYEARGGLDKLKAIETTHMTASLSVSGLSGTVEVWDQNHPHRNRTEVDLIVFKQTTGDNGTIAWALDGNGKLRIEQDENELARRDVARRLADFEHLDRDSDIFTLSMEGVEDVEGRRCYVVKVASTPDHMERVWYIDTEDFLMRKSIERQPEMQRVALHSDYREVGGLLYDFHQDIEMLPLGQSQTLDVTGLEVDVDIDPALFDPPADEAKDFRFIDGGTMAEVPFQFIERHIFLPVTIDGDERLWVLDTGASASVVDRGYAQSLGLELSGEIEGQGAGNTVSVSFTTLPPFAIDGIQFDAQQVAVIDLAGLFRRTSDLEIAGIMGYDFLSRFVTKVDYANELLTFYDPASFHYDGDGVVLDAPLSGNLFSVEAVVDGVHGGRWMLDLGAGSVTFHAPYAKEHGLGDRDGIYGVGFGAGGRIMHHMSRYKTIEFGGNVIENPRISDAGSTETTGAFSSTETTGNLGNSLFRHFVLYLDYANQHVIVERGDDFGKDFPFDRSGLQLWRPEDAVEVLYVSPGTPAAEAGFQEGDVVLTIDGKDVATYGTLRDLRKLLQEEVGTTYIIGIDRGGQSKELELTLRELM